MPIIARVGRRSPKTLAFLGTVYLLLIAGAVSMIYPFLLMLATAVCGNVDYLEYRLLPRYLWGDRALFARYLEEKYYDLRQLRSLYRLPLARLETEAIVQLAHEIGLEDQISPGTRRRVEDFQDFLATLPKNLWVPGFVAGTGSVDSRTDVAYWRHLASQYPDLGDLRRFVGEEVEHLVEVRVRRDRPDARDWIPEDTAAMVDYMDFRMTLPVEYRLPIGMDAKYAEFLVTRFDSEEGLAAEFDAEYRPNRKVISSLREGKGSYLDLVLPSSLPGSTEAADDTRESRLWEDFVRTRWPLALLDFMNPEGGGGRLSGREEAARRFARFLRTFVSDDLAGLMDQYRRDGSEILWSGWDDIRIPEPRCLVGSLRADYIRFLELDPRDPESRGCAIPATLFRLDTPRDRYLTFLRKRYGSGGDSESDAEEVLRNMNRAYETAFADLRSVRFPIPHLDWLYVRSGTLALRWNYLTRNFLTVLRYVGSRGGALLNTYAFVVATILIQLTINPLCAYALSRFPLKYSHRVLLFCLATMAFPAEVVMIPNFLLLRDLGLLNTFGALLLPAAANGYMIFLLKGFFDTLPRELFEAAIMDGAGEVRLFFQVAVPLCKPVLAYIALLGFTTAYMTFLFALLVCQDPRMWTLMVWIYDLGGSPQPVSLKVAAYTVAAAPTLVVFCLCQRVIMRGIVLPQMR